MVRKKNDEDFAALESCFGEKKKQDQCFAPMRRGCLCKTLCSGISEAFSILLEHSRGDLSSEASETLG